MRLRQFAVGCIAVLNCLLSLPATADSHAVVLQYDAVDESAAPHAISAASLQRQLRYLRDNRFRVLPLPELVQRLRSGGELPERSIAITFNDAARIVCEIAAPLLQQAQMPFTVFVNTAAIDAGSDAHCSWEQLQQLAAAGASIANQGSTHRHLVVRTEPTLESWRAQVRAEIDSAERRIQEQIGQSHHLLAWPYGEFNEGTKQIAREAGFIAFGKQPGPIGRDSDWLELPRFSLSRDANVPTLAAKLDTLPFPLAAVHKPDSPLRKDSDAPTLELVLQEDVSRSRILRGKLQCFDSAGRRIGSNWLSETRFRARAYRPLPAGRSLYTCTLPAGNGRFYWFSQAWISADTEHRWPD